MIPAPRTGNHDQPAHGHTITDPGSNQAGPGFRTHRATVTPVPTPPPTTTGDPR